MAEKECLILMPNRIMGYCKAKNFSKQMTKLKLSLLEGKCLNPSCKNKLTSIRNFSNVYCWNCLYSMTDTETANFIAENYL